MIQALWAGMFIFGLAASTAVTYMVRPIASRCGLVSRPRPDRHGSRQVPLGGGIAIFATLVLGIGAGVAALQGHGPRYGLNPADVTARLGELVWFLVCLTAVFALGLWDDFKPIGPWPKLLVQFLAATAAVILADVKVEFFIHNSIVTGLLSVLWIVLLVNVFNFLDNMDGLCAGIAAIVSGILLTASAASGQILIGGFTSVFIGTLAGFLVHNLPPARIFMGDAGSLVVGFMVAVLTIRTTYYHQATAGPWYPILMPLVALAVPLYDFVTVTFLRIRQGKSPLAGDTQHFSHRLKRRGLTDLQTAMTLYLATLCTGLGAICLYQVNLLGAILIMLQTLMIMAIVAILETYARQGP